MNAVASILAVTGTALLSGSTIALRLDRTTAPDDDVDALNYRDLETPEPIEDGAGEPSWHHDIVGGAPTGAWPFASGAETRSASSAYSDGQRLTREVIPAPVPLPGTRLAEFPEAPKLTAGDLRRIRRRIRRDTRPPRKARTTMLRLAGIAALLLTAHRILTPAVEPPQEVNGRTATHSDCTDQCDGPTGR